MSERRMLYSTVIDNSEIFLIQGYIWARSLIENANVDASDILINVIDDHTLDLNPLKRLGINISLSPRFGDGRYCNKASQFNNLYNYVRDFYVLMDSDQYVIGELETIFDLEKLGGKVVDIANPEITVLDELYMQASFVTRPTISKADIDNYKSTYKANLNGGLYVIPSKYLHEIDSYWKKWIIWILDHPNILDQARKLHHTDQVAFSMALTELDIEINALSREYNFPCHLYITEDTKPIILHYHHLLSKEGISNVNPQLKNYTALLEYSNQKISNWIEESGVQIS